jgi:uncharacterized protein YoxC
MYGLLVAVTVLLSVTLVVLIVGVVLYVRRITHGVREIADTLAEARKEIVPLAGDVRYVLQNTDGLVSSARTAVETVGRVAGTVERVVEGKTIADAAGKVASASKSTLVSIVEGMKEALKAFKAAKVEQRETTEDTDKAGQ